MVTIINCGTALQLALGKRTSATVSLSCCYRFFRALSLRHIKFAPPQIFLLTYFPWGLPVAGRILISTWICSSQAWIQDSVCGCALELFGLKD